MPAWAGASAAPVPCSAVAAACACSSSSCTRCRRSPNRRTSSPLMRAAPSSSVARRRSPPVTASSRRGNEAATADGVPRLMARPACMSTISSHIAASSMYGVLTIRASPRPARSRRMRQNSRRLTGSTPVVGSSRISTEGVWINVQLSASFCFMPPESWPARRLRNGSRRLKAISSRSRSARSDFGTPNRSAKKRRFSPTVRSGYRLNRCGM